MFTVHYTVIHTSGTSIAVACHRSPKKAFEAARLQAWADFEKSDALGWANDWAHITNPYGEVIHNDFCS